jgi:hypothetical protein
MTKSFFFWGVIDGDDTDPTWKVLHEYFEALAREDDEGIPEDVSTERKAVKRK